MNTSAEFSHKNFNTSAVRFQRTADLSGHVTQARYVKGAREELMARLGITTIKDLLLHTPFRYLDFTQVTPLGEARIGQEVTIIGTVDKVEVKTPRPRMTIVEVSVVDNTGVLIATFFKQPWIAQQILEGMRVVFSGKIGFSYGFKRMNSPFYEVLSQENEAGDDARVKMLPIHHVTEGLSTSWMRRIIASALVDYADVCDFLPATLRSYRELMPYSRALRTIHFPQSFEEAREARRRLAYDEVLLLQLALVARRDASLAGLVPTAHVVDGPYLKKIQDALPFKLTHDQAQAVRDTLKEMAQERSMNRLILGDVGTGKTAVATVVLGAVADTQTQAALMAPTGVLAQQYALKIGPILDEVGISWALLTGATPAKERQEILAGLASGKITCAFGTHALIEDDVTFKALSLVIIDEQHRFGVEQRTKLRSKGPGADLMVMTATPIPRTLALTIYGDLTSSYLRERPVKGAGIKTEVLKKTDRGVAYDAIKQALKKGHQAYVICPLVGKPPAEDQDDEALINEGDPSDMKAAVQEAKFLSEKVFPDATVDLLTGRMSAAEKDEVMERFRAGKIQVLVATTVVEVGVDVPNATVMMIEDAERFGLSQLHQLRGRVGRGAHSGQVFLVADSRSKNAAERLAALEKTSDGFKLAEYDLMMRREGEIMGKRQHGDVSLKLVDVVEDQELIEHAHDDALDLIAQDPHLEATQNMPLKIELFDRYGDVFTEAAGG